jgi:hypothetical protein
MPLAPDPRLARTSHPPAQDVKQLKSLIQRHLKFTGSEVARRILLSWDRSRPHFRKVFPHEYKRCAGAALPLPAWGGGGGAGGAGGGRNGQPAAAAGGGCVSRAGPQGACGAPPCASLHPPASGA